MRRRSVGGCARWIGLAGLFLASIGSSCHSTPTPPSIVLIVIDTLRPDYLGTYGFDGDISPNLDRLASESLVFTQAFSAAPWTNPSVASVFTSLHPSAHLVTVYGKHYRKGRPPEETGILPDDAITLAESLRAAGYRTAAFQGNPWLDRSLGFAQGFERYRDCRGPDGCGATQDLLDEARDWLRSLGSNRRYFLYVHLMDVHAPYSVPRRHFLKMLESRSLGLRRELTASERGAIPWHLDGPVRLSPDERCRREAWRAKYAACVRALDRRLSSFLEDLKRPDGFDEPLIAFTSDHGEELAEHGRWDHGRTLFEEQLRVPLMVRLPGGRVRGRREQLVSLLDLMPTLLARAGVSPPVTVQGRTLSLTSGGSANVDSPVLATGTMYRPGLHMLRTPTHKLILDRATDEVWLYQLATDSGEQHNVAASDPALTRDLRGRLLHTLDGTIAQGRLTPATRQLSAAARERLRALGYVQ